MNVDYDFYMMNFSGSLIPQEQFQRYCCLGSNFVNSVTNGKAAVNPCENVRLAICAAAEAYFNLNAHDGIASETVGKVSVHYDNSGGAGEKKVFDAVKIFLFGTGLLYQGVM